MVLQPGIYLISINLIIVWFLRETKSCCLNSITLFNTSRKKTRLYSEEQLIISNINDEWGWNIHNLILILNFIIFNV